MNKKFSLEETIKDLDFISSNFNYLLQNNYNNLVAELVKAIGKTSSYDTGLVRDLISNALYDLNRPDLVKELEYRVYEYWKTREQREKENSNYTFNKTLNKDKVKYSLEIEDYGFYNQQLGKVSDIHPRQDSEVIPRNVDYCCDKFETKSNKDAEKEFKNLYAIIIDLLEGEI